LADFFEVTAVEAVFAADLDVVFSAEETVVSVPPFFSVPTADEPFGGTVEVFCPEASCCW